MSSHENNGTQYGFGTKAIHAGQEPDSYSGAVILPISLSSTFAQSSPGVRYPGQFEYARSGNPTRKAFEDCVAALENGKFGLAFSSGLAATMTLMNLLSPGDHVVCVDDVYGGTQRLFRNITAKYGVTFDFIDFNEEGALQAVLKPNTKLVWLETPTNPTLKISDIQKTADLVHQVEGAILVVDNTFMSSYFQSPLDLGADIVMHSVTKYMNGHSDVVMGVLALKDAALHSRIQYFQNALGGVPSPFDCFLAIRGLKTLHVRMNEHERNATHIARFLETHPKIDRVVYPGLPSHPQYELAQRQMRGSGGMITFYLKGGLPQARQFLENLKIFTLAESLGGVESLVDHPVIMTHASVPAEHRAALGISDSLIRLSVGIEDLADLQNDLISALDAVTL